MSAILASFIIYKHGTTDAIWQFDRMMARRKTKQRANGIRSISVVCLVWGQVAQWWLMIMIQLSVSRNDPIANCHAVHTGRATHSDTRAYARLPSPELVHWREFANYSLIDPLII